ncbi:MAG: hypothetical protein A3J97_10685 [Spirochaetes bacterium RIFOXYC1_FULL_54_7]|nr:MAG: hypothetical protein A3J97_10685 [Spirochaetes bacterium RIFOXYC1_FULL_54_7]
MANDIQRTKEIEAFVFKEATKGTLALASFAGSTAIRLSAVPQFNQQPGFTESTEIVNSRSRADRFNDAFPAGSCSLKHYARIGDDKTADPEHNVLYEAALGAKTANDGDKTLYSLAVAKPSVQLLIKESDMVFALVGAVVDKLSAGLQKKGAIEFTHDIRFMRSYRCGKVDFAAGMTYTAGTLTIVLPTAPGDDYKKYAAGMRIKIWDASASAYMTDGTNAYFTIASVDSATNSIVITVIVDGGWTPATGDRIDPWYPTASLPTTRILEMRSGKVYKTTAGGTATPIRSCDFSLADNVQMLEEEITDSGYPEDYVEGQRVVDAKVSLVLRADDLKYFYDGENKTTHGLYIEGRDPSSPTVRTNALQLAMPKAMGNVPALSGENVRYLNVEYAALVSAAVEDELTMTWGDLTA